MARELSNWLDLYLEYSSNTESPTSYHLWCGISAIAGALQRKVYLHWGVGQTLYPNLYVVLVGPAGRTRKGVAIGIAKDLLRDLTNVKIAPESASGQQAMTLVMKEAYGNFIDPTDGQSKLHCSTTVFSEELSVFLGQGNIAYLANLTDWYDSKEEWEYQSVGRGKDKLNGVCLNFLGGTAPDWIQSMIPQEAVGGGFTSRVIFVVEEKKGKIVPEPVMTKREIELRKQLRNDLERINKMAGEMTMNDACRRKYVNWYKSESAAAEAGHPAIDDSRFASYCERRATHLRKLLMVVSAARGDDLLLTEEDFDRTLGFLEAAERNMSKTFGGFGKSRTSDATETIKNFICGMRHTTRGLVLQRYYLDVDAPTLSGIEQTLEQMGCIKTEPYLLDGKMDKKYYWVGEAA